MTYESLLRAQQEPPPLQRLPSQSKSTTIPQIIDMNSGEPPINTGEVSRAFKAIENTPPKSTEPWAQSASAIAIEVQTKNTPPRRKDLPTKTTPAQVTIQPIAPAPSSGSAVSSTTKSSASSSFQYYEHAQLAGLNFLSFPDGTKTRPYHQDMISEFEKVDTINWTIKSFKPGKLRLVEMIIARLGGEKGDGLSDEEREGARRFVLDRKRRAEEEERKGRERERERRKVDGVRAMEEQTRKWEDEARQGRERRAREWEREELAREEARV